MRWDCNLARKGRWSEREHEVKRVSSQAKEDGFQEEEEGQAKRVSLLFALINFVNCSPLAVWKFHFLSALVGADSTGLVGMINEGQY